MSELTFLLVCGNICKTTFDINKRCLYSCVAVWLRARSTYTVDWNVYTHTQAYTQQFRVKMWHSARPNTHIPINHRPEFKCKHLLSIILKKTDAIFCQIDKARSLVMPNQVRGKEAGEEDQFSKSLLRTHTVQRCWVHIGRHTVTLMLHLRNLALHVDTSFI